MTTRVELWYGLAKQIVGGVEYRFSGRWTGAIDYGTCSWYGGP